MYIFPGVTGIIFAFVLITIGSLHEVNTITAIHPVLKDESVCTSYAADLFKHLREKGVDFDSYIVEEAILTQGLQSLFGLLITQPESTLKGLGSLEPVPEERCSFTQSSEGEHVANITLQLTDLSLNYHNAKLSFWPTTTRYSDVTSTIKHATVVLQIKQQEFTGLLEVNSLSVVEIDDADVDIAIYKKGYHRGYDDAYPLINGAFKQSVQEALDKSVKDVLNEHLNSI